jgi:alkylation response protein AidB-like acyl-CoA dehydrogenase
MNFSLTEEQQEVRNLAEQILANEITTDRLVELDQYDVAYDKQTWMKLAEAGLLGVAIDEDYGGMGFDFETLCLLLEQAGKTVAPVPLVPVLASTAMILQQYGSGAQKEAWLPKIVSGEGLLVSALIEPGSADPLLPRSVLTSIGGGMQLHGCKHLVPLAKQAARVMVPAVRDEELVLLLIDPNASGVEVEHQQVTAGDAQYIIQFDSVSVLDEDIVASGADALHAIKALKQYTLAANSVLVLGVIEKMLAMTASYTSEREQFGRPVGTFQAVSHRAADAYIDVDCLRLACEQAVSLLSRREEAGEAVTVAKIWASDTAARVSQSAQHLHGGIGVDRDYPLFRYCLWAKQLELTLGSGASYVAELGDRLAEEFKLNVNA